jgi:UPF0176 protein
MTSNSTAPTPTTVAAFYKFVAIEDLAVLQRDLREVCAARAIKGTILLAAEGINATVSGSADAVAALVDLLRADSRFIDLAVKLSQSDDHPFERLKVKIKPEIVTFGVPEVRPSITTGNLVEPEAWNALISEPDVLLIDTRNDYEVAVGTFAGALNPETRAFGEFPDYVARELAGEKKRKIAMFCTGGIRCEKASAWLKAEGFTNVHQLSGGILKYLERVPPAESFWRGECFVFDARVALEHGVRQGRHGLCSECGYPVLLATDDPESPPLCASCRGLPSSAVTA